MIEAKKLLLIAHIIAVVGSDNCGLKSSPDQWPWSVSLSYETSNLVLCQGTIISDRHVLTAGHCLQHKLPSRVLVYAGLLFYLPPDSAHRISWQLKQINLHPDMKLTSQGRFISGGFVASMEMYADLAIGTLKRVIQFSDTISPVCLMRDGTVEFVEVSGGFSGWNGDSKSFALFNATVEQIDGDVFMVPHKNKSVRFMEGTGFFSLKNSSWTIIGLMTMNDFGLDGVEKIKFINLHKYANWITNFLRNMSSDELNTQKMFDEDTSMPILTSSTVSSSLRNGSDQSTLPNSFDKLTGNGSWHSSATEAVGRLNNRMLPYLSFNATTVRSIAEGEKNAPTHATNSIATTVSSTPTAAAASNVIVKDNLNVATVKTLSKAENSIITSSTEPSSVAAVTSATSGNTDSLKRVNFNAGSQSITSSESTINNDTLLSMRTSSHDVNSTESKTAPPLIKTIVSPVAASTNVIASSNLDSNATVTEDPSHSHRTIASVLTANSIYAGTKLKPLITSITASTRGVEDVSFSAIENSILPRTKAGSAGTWINTTPLQNSVSRLDSINNKLTGEVDNAVRVGDEPSSSESIITTTTPLAVATMFLKHFTVESPQSDIQSVLGGEIMNRSTIESTSPMLPSAPLITTESSVVWLTNKGGPERVKEQSTHNVAIQSVTESSSSIFPSTQDVFHAVSIAGELSEKLSAETPRAQFPQGRNLKGFDNTTNAWNSSQILSNSTEIPQNTTESGEMKQPLLAVYGLNATAINSIVFVVSLMTLFIIFCILGRQKPTTEAH